MNRTEKFFSNTTVTFVKEIIAIICGFITPRIILKYYGSDINGLVTSIYQIITYFNVIEAGLGASIIYSLYKPLAEKDISKINGIVSAARRFYLKSGWIFTAAVAGMAVIYPLFVSTDQLPQWGVSALVMIMGFSGAMEFLSMSKYRTLLTADQRTYVISLSIIAQKVVETIIIVGFAFCRMNIVMMRLLALSAVLVRSFILHFYVRKNYTFLDYSAQPDLSALSKRWDAMYQQLISLAQNGVPIVFLTFFSGLKTVSVYSIYNMAISGIRVIFDVLTTSSTATFGEILYKDDRKVLQSVYKSYEFIYYSIITLAYSICAVMILPFVKLYTAGIKDSVYVFPLIGALFVINGLLYNIKSPQSMLVNAAGMYKETRIQSTIQILIIVIGGLVLTPLFGLAGMLVALIASNIYRDIDLILFASKKITGLKIGVSGFRVLRMFLTFIAVWVPFMFVNINPGNYFYWILYAVVTGIYALAVHLIISLLFERNEVKNVIIRARTLVKIKPL